MNRAALFTRFETAICPNCCGKYAVLRKDLCSDLDKAAFNKVPKGDFWLCAFGFRHGNSCAFFDSCDSAASVDDIFFLAFKADKFAAEFFRNGARRACAKEGVDNDIAGVCCREDNAV